MPKALTILKEDPRFSSKLLDFELLRQQGIDYVAALSGDLWTDYNLHDPGITILEVLCYALIDLGYRNQLPIEELLAMQPSTTPSEELEDNFFSPKQILTCNPLTILDYRKMLLDIDGVRNAWLEPTGESEIPLFVNCDTAQIEFDKKPENQPLILNGLYRVLLELDSHFSGEQTDECFDKNHAFDRIYQEVQEKLHSHRNLCEDFVNIQILKKEQIGICADIELNPAADHEDTLVEIYENIQEFLSPTLQFYTLKGLLDKQIPIEEIYEGRPTSESSNGFILTEELAALDRKRELHASDLYRVILQDERVKSVKNLTLFNFLDGARQTTGEDWCLQLTEGYHPVLAPELSKFKFYKGAIPFNTKKTQKRSLEKFSKRISNISKVKLGQYALDKMIPYGEYRPDLGAYPSIQNEFPLVYGIGEGHLNQNATKERQAQALQLKAYLLFFDQLLANYAMQMSHLRDLFSLRPESKRTKETQQTFFSQVPDDVPQIEQLLQFHHKKGEKDDYEKGETIALFSLNDYEKSPKTAAERDAFIQKLQRLFATEKASIESFQINDAPANPRFGFCVKDGQGRQFLVSKKSWESSETAEKQGEILNFLIPLAENFKTINNQQEGIYSFEIRYSPQSYVNYLKQITENQTQFLQRRDGFLNHLLARFAEDFNDYVLLNFGVNEGIPELKEVVEDKGQFLSQYPEISRDRGTGIDCLDAANIWDSKNITGLEKRVTSLLGIPDWQRKNLSNFVVKERTDLFGFEYRDHRGNLLFKNAQNYSTEAEATEAMERFCDLAKDENNYDCYECAADCVFGIRILDGENIVATHPTTYPSAEKRDAAKACLAALMTAGGLMANVRQGASGFRVSVRNKSEVILLESATVFEVEDAAWEAWLLILAAAGIAENYQVQPTKVGDGYSFNLSILENGQRRIIAQHPASYSTKSVATRRKNEAIKYFQTHGLPFEIEQEAPKYGWELQDNEGEILLKGYQNIQGKEADETTIIHHFFKQPIQAKSLVLNILKWVAEGKAVWEIGMEDGEFYFYLLQNETLHIAHSLPFSTETERDEALERVKQYLQYLVNNLEKLLWDSFAYQFQIYDKNGIELLKGTQYFRKKKDLKIASAEAQNRACSSANWQIAKVEDCCFQVQLLNACAEPIARSALFDTYEDARDFYAKIKGQARAQQWTFEREETDEKYGFSIYEYFPAAGNLLLNSHQLYANPTEALCAFFTALNNGKNIANYRKKKDKKQGHQFVLEDDCGQILATSPIGFSSKKKRDAALNELVDCLQSIVPFIHIPAKEGLWQYALLNNEGDKVLSGTQLFEQRGEALKALYQMLKLASDKTNFSEKQEEGSYRFGFDLRKAEEVVATHPHWYFPKEEMETALKNLHDFIQKKRYNVAVEKEEGKFFFELDWVGCSGSCEPVLRSEEWATKEEAEAATKRFRKAINTVIADVSFYHFQKIEKDARHSFALQLNDGEVFATHPNGFFNQRERDVVLEDLKQYLVNNRENNKVVTNHFNTATAPENEEGFGYELEDELLNSQAIYASENQAWSNLKDLLNSIQKDDGIFRFTDFDKDCCRSFKAVNATFRVAKHPVKYPTTEMREVVRDWLANQAVCLPYSTVCCGTICINDAFHFVIYEAIDGVKTKLWQSCDGYKDERMAKAAYQAEFIQILEYARSIEYYRFKKNELGQCAIQLQDERGKCLAILPCPFEMDNGEARLAAILKRLKHALLFPVFANQERFQFQAYDFEFDLDYLENEAAILIEQKARNPCICGTTTTDILAETPDCDEAINELPISTDCGCEEQLYWVQQAKTLLTGRRIWESCQTYQTAHEAFCAFQHFHENILPNKANFQWEGDSTCGPFELVVVDPRQVLATHPNCYQTDHELKDAIAQTLSTLAVEGFHVLEHILLRPREVVAVDSLLPSCPSKNICDKKNTDKCGEELTDEEKIFADYLPGADPYSFWATVVLPYWPKRFLNNNFRLFLEETIRKEAPAHVGLHIAWVSPQQMESFEKAYRNWLEAKGNKGQCDLQGTQDALLNMVKALRNEFPSSRLQSPCEDRSNFNPVYLGFSKLK